MQCQNNMQYNNAQKRIICKCVGKKYKIEDYKGNVCYLFLLIIFICSYAECLSILTVNNHL